MLTAFTFAGKVRAEVNTEQQFPLSAARQAHELLGKGGVAGKLVLVSNGSSLNAGAA
jgi:hypothetical protein